ARRAVRLARARRPGQHGRPPPGLTTAPHDPIADVQRRTGSTKVEPVDRGTVQGGTAMHHLTRTAPRRTVALAALTTLAAAGSLAACSSSDSPGTGASGGSDDTYTWWDPYPQHDEKSDW